MLASAHTWLGEHGLIEGSSHISGRLVGILLRPSLCPARASLHVAAQQAGERAGDGQTEAGAAEALRSRGGLLNLGQVFNRALRALSRLVPGFIVRPLSQITSSARTSTLAGTVNPSPAVALIDDDLECRRLLNREIAGSLALQDSIDTEKRTVMKASPPSQAFDHAPEGGAIAASRRHRSEEAFAYGSFARWAKNLSTVLSSHRLRTPPSTRNGFGKRPSLIMRQVVTRE